MAQHQGPGRQKHGQREPHSPDIEGITAQPHHYALQFVSGISDEPGQGAGQHQHRKHLAGYVPYIRPEPQLGRGPYHRYNSGNQQGSCNVNKSEVGYGLGQGASEFVGYNARGRCCGADKAEHCALKENTLFPFETRQHEGYAHEQQHLEDEGQQVPAPQLKVVGRYLHKLEEHQQGDHEPLPFACPHTQRVPIGMQGGQSAVQKIQTDAQHDSAGQHPILNYSFCFSHFRTSRSARNRP